MPRWKTRIKRSCNSKRGTTNASLVLPISNWKRCGTRCVPMSASPTWFDASGSHRKLRQGPLIKLMIGQVPQPFESCHTLDPATNLFGKSHRGTERASRSRSRSYAHLVSVNFRLVGKTGNCLETGFEEIKRYLL